LLLCNSTGFGSNGVITFQHHDSLLEEFKPNTLQSILSPESLYSTTILSGDQFFFIQLGYHACFAPFNQSSLYSTDYIKTAEGNIKSFLDELAEVLKPFTREANNVIISMTGRTFPTDDRAADVCTWRLNRMIAYHAHTHGWMLLEREEIEHRLLLKTDYADEPIRSVHSLLTFPAPQIIASSAIAMIDCVNKQYTFELV